MRLKRIGGGVIYLVFFAASMFIIVECGKAFPEAWKEWGMTPPTDLKYLVATFSYWYVYLLLGIGVFIYFFLHRRKTLLPCLFMVCLTYIVIGYPYSTIVSICGTSGLEYFRYASIYLMIIIGIFLCLYLYRKKTVPHYLFTIFLVSILCGYYYSTFDSVSCMSTHSPHESA
jgi:hypothetical protein